LAEEERAELERHGGKEGRDKAVADEPRQCVGGCSGQHQQQQDHDLVGDGDLEERKRDHGRQEHPARFRVSRERCTAEDERVEGRNVERRQPISEGSEPGEKKGEEVVAGQPVVEYPAMPEHDQTEHQQDANGDGVRTAPPR
jgi:hypothetical protein